MRAVFTLAFFFEGQFALLVVVFVLSTTSVFTALGCKSVCFLLSHLFFECVCGILGGCEGPSLWRASYFSLILGHNDILMGVSGVDKCVSILKEMLLEEMCEVRVVAGLEVNVRRGAGGLTQAKSTRHLLARLGQGFVCGNAQLPFIYSFYYLLFTV